MDGAVIEGSQCIGQNWIMYRATFDGLQGASGGGGLRVDTVDGVKVYQAVPTLVCIF